MDSVQAKLSADIARHAGRRRNSNECFGVCCRESIPWYFTGEDMKWYIDWLGIRGVNMYIPYAFYYSVDGKQKEERTPDVGPNNIWWKHYRKFSDYMKRLSYLMADSVNCARTAVLCDNNRVPHREVQALYEDQIEFNYLPVGMLADSEMEDGTVCIRGYRYEVILDVLGYTDAGALSGCHVVHSAEGLLEMTTYPSGEAIRTIGLGAGCEPIRAVHLVKEGLNLYLLSNEGEGSIGTKLIVPGKGRPILVDLWNGSYIAADGVERKDGVCLDITLEACETVLVVLDESGAMTEETKELLDLGDWTSRFALIEKVDNQAVYELVRKTAGAQTQTEKTGLNGLHKTANLQWLRYWLLSVYVFFSFLLVTR